MSTVDKDFADNIAKHGGWHNGDSDNSMGDNPQCVRIVEYDNAWGGKGYGLVFHGQRNRYESSEFVRNPRDYWTAAGSAGMTTTSGTAAPTLCSDCPPAGYPNEKTRCLPCPRRPVAASPAELLADALFVLGMVDKNNRIDAGEPGKAWSGRFVVEEVRRVLAAAALAGMSAHTPAHTGQSIYADPKAPHQELTAAQRAILEAVPVLNADSVRAYAARKWPQAMHSPLAQAMHGASAMTMLEASDADAVALRGEAMAHAQACLAACDGWTVETLGHNIESAFGMDLGADECDEIARAAIANATGGAP